MISFKHICIVLQEESFSQKLEEERSQLQEKLQKALDTQAEEHQVSLETSDPC